MISPQRIALISAILLSICSCTPQQTPPLQEYRKVTISELKEFYNGEPCIISDNICIECTVAGSDWLGELHKSAIVIDDTGGLELGIESTDITNTLPIYSDIVIYCGGLVLARMGGKMKLGTPPTGIYPVDNILDESFDHYIHVVRLNSDREVATKQIAELREKDIGSVVRFEGVRICDEERGVSWCDLDEEGEPITTTRTLVDGQGERLEVRIISTCEYGKELIPQKEIAVIGAIDYADDHYFLRILNKSITEL